MNSPGDERPWVASAGAPAATILPGRATWMMRRGEALLAAWEADAQDAGRDSADSGPGWSPAQVEDVSHDASGPDASRVAPQPSAAEIIAGTVSGLATPAASPTHLTHPAAPAPAEPAPDVAAQLRLGVDEVMERLAAQVAGFELDMRRIGEELRRTVAEHRAEVRTVRQELDSVREWVRLEGHRLAREAALAVTREIADELAEQVVRSLNEELPRGGSPVPGRVPVDPRRLLGGIAARVGLPATHVAAVQGWAARDHRSLVEVVHPGARRRLGIVAAAYGATLGYRVCILVPRPADAAAWRTDLAAHAPEVSVAGRDRVPAGTEGPDVRLAADPAEAAPADLVVADLSCCGTRAPVGPGLLSAPQLLGLSGRGEAARVAALADLPVLGPV
jgi:hypothetical protein